MERPFRAYKGEEPYVFVSYAHADAAVVYPELVRLKEEGFNIWYDEGIAPGQTWRDEVALALTQCKVFLYFVTPRSIASSNCLKGAEFQFVARAEDPVGTPRANRAHRRPGTRA